MAVKYLKKLWLIPLLLLSFGCSGDQAEGIAYLKSLDGSIAEIDSANGQGTNSDLIKMMKLNKSFVFYVTSAGCSSCHAFENMLARYLPQSKLLLYSVTMAVYDAMPSSLRTSVGLPRSVLTPTLFFVKSGKVLQYISYEPTAFTDEVAFEKMLKKYGTFTDLTYALKKHGAAYAEETDASEPSFDESFSGQVIYYETITEAMDKDLIKNSQNGYYAYDLSAQIAAADFTSIDQDKYEDYLTKHHLLSENSTLPILVTYTAGAVSAIVNI